MSDRRIPRRYSRDRAFQSSHLSRTGAGGGVGVVACSIVIQMYAEVPPEHVQLDESRLPKLAGSANPLLICLQNAQTHLSKVDSMESISQEFKARERSKSATALMYHQVDPVTIFHIVGCKGPLPSRVFPGRVGIPGAPALKK